MQNCNQKFQKLTQWIKNNKLTSVLIAIIVILIAKTYYPNRGFLPYNQSNLGRGGSFIMEDMAMSESFAPQSFKTSSFMPPIGGGASPRLDVTDRKVVTNSNLSLQVKDVNNTIKAIKAKATEFGGFMVNSNLSTPEGLSNGNITIRIPTQRSDEMLEVLRGLAVKVVSENVSGRDVTDQYVDVEERLGTLELTKSKFEQILNISTDIEDILLVTEKIIYIQDQIDNLKGRLQYLDTTSRSTLITVYLSTDELELPYAPTQAWRPTLVLKEAVRTVRETGRDIANFGIWIFVFGVYWVPALIGIWLWKKKSKKSKAK